MRWSIIVCAFVFSFASEVRAAKSFANLNVASNGLASLEWSIPCEQPGGTVSMYGSFPEFGSTGNSISYTGSVPQKANEDIDLVCGSQEAKKTFPYAITSTIKGPGYIFEFPIVYTSQYEYTQDQEVMVAYPSSLILAAASHPYITTPDGKIQFNLKFSGQDSTGDTITLTFADKIPSGGNDHSRIGPFDVYAEDRHVRQIKKVAWAMPAIISMFSETIGANLNSPIVILVTDLQKIHTAYEASGVTIGPNVIILDSGDLIEFSEIGLLQLLTHELTHAITWGTALNPEVPWFTEGIAVFHEYYFIDEYVPRVKDVTGTFTQIISDYPKFYFENLSRQYEKPFDYEFVEDTENHPIIDSYSHTGMVFYKLFLDDKSILKKFAAESEQYMPEPNCPSCNSKRALAVLQRISGNSKNDILFPFRGSSDIPPQYAVLFSKSVSHEEETQVWTSYYKSRSGGYFTNNDSVENYDYKPSNLQEKTTVETNVYPKKQSDPAAATSSQTTEDILPEKESRISRFFNWLLNLF